MFYNSIFSSPYLSQIIPLTLSPSLPFTSGLTWRRCGTGDLGHSGCRSPTTGIHFDAGEFFVVPEHAVCAGHVVRGEGTVLLGHAHVVLLAIIGIQHESGQREHAVVAQGTLHCKRDEER